jgi:hypothetical protein
MSTLIDAVASIGHALRRGGDNLDLFGGYTNADDGAEFVFVLILSEDVPCHDLMGPVAGVESSQIAFAEAATFEEALILLAARLAEAGYGAVAAR